MNTLLNNSEYLTNSDTLSHVYKPDTMFIKITSAM